ncbi:uncharacterized protein [Nicotiana tomentosiformis]|uniref:uncharacterized protein n=1 Tax=Nicotiana tomentosiformis TaxID=4098 RepID=UPI00388CB6F0
MADALSRKVESLGSLAYILVAKRPLALDVEALSNQERQYDDPHLLVLKDTVQHGDAKEVTIVDDDIDGQSECTIQILEDMLRVCVIDLGGPNDQFLPLAKFAYNNGYQSSIQMAPYEALYGRQCQSLDASEKVKLIQERLRTAQSRQKSYAEQKVCEITYMVGEKVMLKISPMKGVLRFRKKGKLSPRHIGPFEVIRKIGEVVYGHALSPSLLSVHLVFHVSMLRKYVGDPSHVLDFSTVQLDGNLTYYVEAVVILDRQIRKLRSKNIASVKVQWRGQPVREDTWETEREMRNKYPHLFETPDIILNPFEDEHLFKRERM